MVSPNLIRRNISLKPAEINENAKRLFQIVYKNRQREAPKDGAEDDTPTINVSDVVSKLAFFYEKIRNVIDNSDDYLLRKNAIIRILKRKIVIEGALKSASRNDCLEISEHLITELIRGSYLPNDKIPETKIGEVAQMLEKYVHLKNLCVARINRALNGELDTDMDVNKIKDLIKEKNSLTNWILSLAACEIEENFNQNAVKQAVIANLYDFLSRNIKLADGWDSRSDLDIQIYLSVCRTYGHFDRDMLSLVLFKYYNNNWGRGDLSESDIVNIGSRIKSLRDEIQRQINHPFSRPLDRITKKYALYSSIMIEAIERDPIKAYNEIYTNSDSFFAQVKKVCAQRYRKAKSRLWRVAGRSIIYIFLTKSIFVVLLEIPATQWFNEPINYVSLAINIAFPALLLFTIVLFTRTPGDDNTKKIISGIKEMYLRGFERNTPLLLRPKNKRHLLANIIFNLIYSLAFLLSFYLILKVLAWIHFNWVSTIIFLFFLAFVSFFSVVTTSGVKDLIVIEKRDSIFTILIDLFCMPIVMIGKWMSRNVSKVNVFVFVFDFIIEAPFKVIVEVAEDWTRYVRERKDNI